MDRLSAKHRDFLLFGALTAPMAIACGGLDALAAVPAIAAALLLYVLLQRRIPMNGSLGSLLPRWLLLPELLFLAVAAAAAASMAPVCWPGGGSDPLFPLTLLVLAGAAAHQGTGAVGRCASVLTWFIGVFFALVLLFAVRETPRTTEIGRWKETVPVLSVALLPVCGLFLPAEKGEPIRLWGSALLYTILLLLVTQGKRGELPLMTAVKGIELFGVLQRFEALAACALTVGLFLALSVLAGSAGELFRCIGFRRVSGAVILAPAAVLIFWIEAIPEWALMLGCAIFWGLIPLSTLFVVPKKEK